MHLPRAMKQLFLVAYAIREVAGALRVGQPCLGRHVWHGTTLGRVVLFGVQPGACGYVYLVEEGHIGNVSNWIVLQVYDFGVLR